MEQCSCGMGHHYGPRPLKVIVGVLLAFFLITLSFNNLKKFHTIGQAPRQPYSITITGTGKITSAPNIATTQVGLVTEKSDAGAAQSENSQKMNKLIAALQGLGIAQADLKTTQYQVYPKYSYDAKAGSTITGYSVSQNVEVKIRDLQKISAVLAAAAAAGSNQVSGIAFTIDDQKKLEAEAREAAIKDAKEKAEVLADQLGVELGRVVSFSESQGGAMPQPYPMMAKESVGAAPQVAPDIQAGSLEIQSDVAVTFEIEE